MWAGYIPPFPIDIFQDDSYYDRCIFNAGASLATANKRCDLNEAIRISQCPK